FCAWTDRLVEVGLALTEKRAALFDRLSPQVRRFYRGLLEQDPGTEAVTADKATADASSSTADHTLSLYYLSSLGQDRNEQSFRQQLQQRKEDEIARKQSLVGPHRDDLVFEIDGRGARSFASQGQQRQIALAWKLAQLAVIEDLCQTRPLLLLDDVMSEFDQKRRHFLANLVGAHAQTVITTANIDYFDDDLIARAKVIPITAQCWTRSSAQDTKGTAVGEEGRPPDQEGGSDEF
ncbi:MAG: hypothetical protein FWF11_04245, partial [Coriobacteriia bacterium]|nr:hypothetical protein [Coriobacteriia bacterium]